MLKKGMIIPTKEEIRAHLKMLRKEFPRDLVAESIGVSLSTLNNSLAHKEMSEDMRYNIAKLTGMIELPSDKPAEIPNNIVNLSVPHESWNNWEKAALSQSKTVSDWLIDTGNVMAEELLAREFGIVAMPTRQEESTYELKIPSYLAAGAGIDPDATDDVELVYKKYPNSYRGARIKGDSMDDGSENAIPDGCIAVMDTEWSGKPYPAKNKIYAWYTEDGNKLKKFVRRKVDGKTQLFLESLNPDHPPIPYEESMYPQAEFIEVLNH